MIFAHSTWRFRFFCSWLGIEFTFTREICPPDQDVAELADDFLARFAQAEGGAS